MKDKYCRIGINEDGMLLLCMPDGTPIPMQTDITIKQDVDGNNYVTVEFIIKDLNFIKIDEPRD